MSRLTANALADNVSLLSAHAFTSVRQKAERQNRNFSYENIEVYNRPFFIQKLHDCLCRAHATSAGPDEIHHQLLLKHLPKSFLLLLLNICNKIWIPGDLPSD